MEDVSVETLGLPVRALSALDRLGIKRVGDLEGVTAEALLELPNCGKKTVSQISKAMETLGFRWAPPQGATEVAAVPSSDDHEPDVLHINLYQRLADLQLGKKASRCADALGAQYVGDIARLGRDELRQCSACGEGAVNELERAIGKLGLELGMQIPRWGQRSARNVSARNVDALEAHRTAPTAKSPWAEAENVEDEIDLVLGHLTKPRNRRIVLARIGLDRDEEPTLESVGQRFKLTRERVRQVVAKEKKQILGRRIHPSRLAEAVEFVHQQAPAAAEDVRQALMDLGFLEGSTVSGLLRAARVFGLPAEVSVKAVSGTKVVVLPGQHALLRKVVSVARRLVARAGCTTVLEVAIAMGEQHDQKVSEDLVAHLLSSSKGFDWLDQERGWFWYTDLPPKRNRIVNQIEKVLSVAQRLPISELRQAVGRHHRMEGFSPPKRVLLALCDKLDGCEIEDDEFVVDTADRDPGDFISELEQVMYLAAGEHGAVFESRSFEKVCLDAGINNHSFWMYLQYSPIIRRFAPGVYGLVGATPSPGQVQDIRERLKRGRARRRSVLQDHGWTKDGLVWIAYRLSEGSVRSGVLGLPSALRKIVGGAFELKSSASGSQEARVLGTLVAKDSSIWGFGPFFTRSGAEAGDLIIVRLDNTARSATIDVGDDALDRVDS